ncbi:RNA polymerase sigma factor [Propioniciclava soli]|uniref:RNA polymerase sigma factor n=1 Tax=Propioniciclava soli TaxID=2775081 RepID=UPI001E595061|nr:sigma factor-like helix-turn-helix DNA-binding protein [Propioniciclava soli]
MNAYPLGGGGSGSPMASSLESWETAVDAVARYAELAQVRGAVALGHLTILHVAHGAVRELVADGRLTRRPEVSALVDELRSVAVVLRDGLDASLGGRVESGRFVDGLRLQLGEASAGVSQAAQCEEPAEARLRALLASGVGAAGRVAAVVRADPAPFERLQGAAQELERVNLSGPVLRKAVGPIPERGDVADQGRGAATVLPPTPRVPAGVQLDPDVVVALCRSRDAGQAARRGESDHPSLRGVNRAQWPRLVEEGRLAVADLVESVRPMAIAAWAARRGDEDDLGVLFERVSRAALNYDPEHASGGQWSTYAWQVVHRAAGGMGPGVRELRSRTKEVPVSWDGASEYWLPADEGPGPAGWAEAGGLVDVVMSLPSGLREPLLRSIRGETHAEIAERIGASTATVARRLERGREEVARAVGYDPRRRGVSR